METENTHDEAEDALSNVNYVVIIVLVSIGNIKYSKEIYSCDSKQCDITRVDGLSNYMPGVDLDFDSCGFDLKLNEDSEYYDKKIHFSVVSDGGSIDFQNKNELPAELTKGSESDTEIRKTILIKLFLSVMRRVLFYSTLLPVVPFLFSRISRYYAHGETTSVQNVPLAMMNTGLDLIHGLEDKESFERATSEITSVATVLLNDIKKENVGLDKVQYLIQGNFDTEEVDSIVMEKNTEEGSSYKSIFK